LRTLENETIAVHHIARGPGLAIVRRLFAWMGVIFLLSQGIVVSWIVTMTPAPTGSWWLSMTCIWIVYALIGVRLAKRMWRRLATYQLTLGPNVLRVVQAGAVPTELFRHDVTRIVELRTGLRIEHGRRRFVGVPRALDGYESVRARLASWCPIERARLVPALAILSVAVFGGIAGMLPLSRPLAIVGNLALAAGFAFYGWRASRSTLMRRGMARVYVVSAAAVLWALWRIHAVWP
jgi:hypothetical protein